MFITENISRSLFNEDVTIPKISEKEDAISIFPLKELIKEYNHRAINSPFYRKLCPLSLLFFEESEKNAINISKTTVIPAMTAAELAKISQTEIHADDWHRLNNIVKSIQDNFYGIGLETALEEIGLTGAVIYEMINGKICVIVKHLKKYPVILKTMKYLKNTQIVNYAAKLVNSASKSSPGAIITIAIFGVIKTYEALECLYKNGSLNSEFFASIEKDIYKTAFNGVVTAAVMSGLAIVGIPVSATVGIVLAVSIAVGTDYLADQPWFMDIIFGAAGIILKNLKKTESSPPVSENLWINRDLLKGMTFQGNELALGGHRQLQMQRKENLFIYSV